MTRFAAFLFPIWMLGAPSLLYWHDRAHGLIPTAAEWQSAAHSSGPWQGDYALLFYLSFALGCVVHLVAVGVFLQLRQRRTAWAWVCGGGLGFICSVVSWFHFGYLME